MKKLLCFCIGLVFTFSYAQDGSPDASFGTNGVIIYDFGGADYAVMEIDESLSGRIMVLIKIIDINSEFEDNLFAFNQDGSLDTNFGTNGVLNIDNPTFDYYGLKILPDGSYFLKSLSNSQFTVSKFGEDGTLDTSFGNNGILQPFTNGGEGSSLIVDADQTLYFIGKQNIAGETHLIMNKFLENGLPDNTFGNNGSTLFSLGTVTNVITTNFFRSGDNFYLGVNVQENNNPSKNIFRFLLNGDIDNSFGTNGRVVIPIEEEFYVGFSVFNNGEILIGGSYWDWITETNVSKIIKINAQGQILQNFGNGGVINGRTIQYIQGNQRFIADGTYIDFEGGATLSYSRYFANGTQDSSFQFSSNYNSELGGFALKQLQNGKILIVGSDIWYNGPEINIILQLFNNNPLSVSEFDKNSIAVYPNPSNAIFKIHFDMPITNIPFEIFDGLGRKVKLGNFNENITSIDLSSLERGVYFLKLADISQTVKLIKK
ncbi:MAG: hypothetical protein COY56_00610 [Flavobacteriaceae bacterium CG_4_10_14_0_8_um_filter_34_31]|nr:MAG: hypothetical protein COY56_00610 [Flavobacteriaceae bacterium CG_4_10_14_0_8_um_filter_34_31]